MVVAGEGVDGKARYRLLETMREYGLRALDEDDEPRRASEEHLSFYRYLGEDLWRAGDTEYVLSLDRAQEDIGNFRAAMSFALESQRPEHVLQIVGALGEFWFSRSVAEGYEWLKRAWTDEPPQSPAAMRAASWGTNYATHAGDLDMAGRLADASIVLARGFGNPRWLAEILGTAVWVRTNRGDASALELAAEALEHARNTEDPQLVCRATSAAAIAELDFGSVERARELNQASLDLADRYGTHRDKVTAVLHLSEALIEQDERDAARESIARLLRLAHESGDLYGEAVSLLFMAELEARDGRADRAVRLAGAGTRAWDDAIGMSAPREWRRVERWLEPVRAKIGPDRFEALWAEGYAMSPEQGLAYAAGAGRPSVTPASLSARETEVAQLVAEGLTNREIAEKLVLSERTVDAHLEHIRNKLGLRKRAQIASWVTDQRVH